MYERRSDPLLPRAAFLVRLALHAGLALAGLALALAAGVAGNMRFQNLAPADAFLDAALLLAGAGPESCPVTRAGKLFVGGYALSARLVLVLAAAALLAPIVHRALHRFHLERER
jgi:hypothetical protein